MQRLCLALCLAPLATGFVLAPKMKINKDAAHHKEKFDLNKLSMDEDGFKAVATMGSSAAMTTFFRKLVASMGLHIKDEMFMRNVMPYYSGECANQTYQDLLGEMKRARKAKACHPAWIQGNEPIDAADKDYMRPRTKMDKEKAAVLLLRGVMAELGAKVVEGQGAQLWEFAGNFLQANSTVQSLKRQLGTNKDKFKPWVHFGKPAYRTHAVNDIGSQLWLAEVGKVAPLNEEGYEAVVFARNETQMFEFMQRVASHAGLLVKDADALRGMAPYYSGLCARQTLAALVHELKASQPSNYLTKVAFSISAQEMPGPGKLRQDIAEQLGVAVETIHLELVNEDEDVEAAPKQIVAQNPSTPALPAEAVAPAETAAPAQAAVPAKIEKPLVHQKFVISVATDSVDALHSLKQALSRRFVDGTSVLKSAAGVEAKLDVNSPWATEPIGMSKPAECGGTLVTGA